MFRYTVCTQQARYGVSPASLTPGFPSLLGRGEGHLIVFVQPLHLLPDGDQVEQYLLGHEGVQVPREGLAVVEFPGNDGSVAPDVRREAQELWCRFARLLGWRLWHFPDSGLFPLQEIGDGEQVVALLGQGEPLRLVLAKRSLSEFWPSIQSFSHKDAA